MSTYYAARPAVDPGPFEKECRDRQLPTDWFGTCNLFEVPLGKGPGRGRILLRKSDLDRIDLTADHDLNLSDPAGNVVPLKSITLLRATCVDPGAAASPGAVYLCELVDRRWHLARVPVDLGFNVRNYDGTDYLPESLLIGAPYTWQKVVNTLAVTTLGLPDLTLPFSPDEPPENLIYFGGWAWDALCDVLARLACAPKYDPTADVFTIVQLGDPAAVTAFDAARAKLAGEKTWDSYPVEPARGRRPEKVRVLFPRRPQPQDGTSVYHHEDVTLAAAAGVVAGSYVTLDGDLTADGTVAGSPDNAAALATRAAERAADYLRKLTGFDRRIGLVYRDDRPEAVPQLLGAAAGSVLFDDRGGPVRTEVRAGPSPAPPKPKLPRLDCCKWGADDAGLAEANYTPGGAGPPYIPAGFDLLDPVNFGVDYVVGTIPPDAGDVLVWASLLVTAEQAAIDDGGGFNQQLCTCNARLIFKQLSGIVPVADLFPSSPAFHVFSAGQEKDIVVGNIIYHGFDSIAGDGAGTVRGQVTVGPVPINADQLGDGVQVAWEIGGTGGDLVFVASQGGMAYGSGIAWIHTCCKPTPYVPPPSPPPPPPPPPA